MFTLHTNHTYTQQPQTHTHTHTSRWRWAAATSSPEGKLMSSKWKYRHDFNLLEVKDENVHVKCWLCPRAKCVSTSTVSNSDLMKRLSGGFSSCVIDRRTWDTTRSFGNSLTSYFTLTIINSVFAQQLVNHIVLWRTIYMLHSLIKCKNLRNNINNDWWYKI